MQDGVNNWKLQIAANVHECEERNKVRRALVERALGSRADGQLIPRYIAHRREAASRQSSAAGRCVCLYGRSGFAGTVRTAGGFSERGPEDSPF